LRTLKIAARCFSCSLSFPSDLDVHRDRALAAQDAGEHRDALLGEGIGRVAATAVAVT